MHETTEANVTELLESRDELARTSSRMAALISHLHDGVLVEDHRGRILVVNDAFCRMFALAVAPRELEGSERGALAARTGPLFGDAEAFQARTRRLRERRELVRDEELRLADGRIFDRDYIPISTGALPAGSLWVYRDVTERRRADEALRESEDRFREVFRHAPIGMALVAPEGTFLRVNRALCDIVGYPEEELVRLGFPAITHPEDLDADLGLAQKLFAGEIESYQLEKRYIHRDGHPVWILLSGSVVRDAKQRPAYAIAQIVDISARKETEERLRRSEEKYRSLFQDTRDAVFMTAPDGRIVEANEAALELFGYDRTELGTLNAADTYADPAGREAFQAAMAETGELVDHEHRIRRRDGSVRTTWLTAVARRDERGRLLGYQGVLHDVTERLRMQEELARSERKFRSLIEGSSDLITLVDGEGFIRYESPSLMRVLAYRPEELVGEPAWRVVHPEDLDRVRAAFAESVGTPGRELSVRFRCRHASGGWRTLDAVGRNLLYDPEIASIVVNSRDVTDQVAAEERVRASEERYRGLFDNASDMIVSLVDGDRIAYANRAFREKLGYGDGSVGLSARTVVHPGSRSDVAALYERVRRGEDVGRVQAQLRTVDGREITVEGTLSCRSEGGEVVEVHAIFDDITGRRAVERLKDEFVSVVSHELRTPLTSLRGSLGLLNSGKVGELSAPAQRMTTIAVQNTDRLIHLINDILDLERIESGRIPLERELTSLGPIMQEAVEMVAEMAERHAVALETEPVDLRLEVDPHRIRQTLVNLLTNAIKFSPGHGTVWMWAERQGAEVVVRVADEGRGIPADKLESVFGRFQQVDASDSREKGGTGLGLAICRSIVSQHDGEIWAESEPGQGATVSFTLPLPDDVDHTPASIIPRPATILLCDDDPDIRSAASAVLKRRGYQPLSVAHGREVLAEAVRHQPDAILLDLIMPGVSGWEIMAALKADPRTRDIPVVVLSRLSREEAGGPLEPAGWLTKPVSARALTAGVEAALRQPTSRPRALVVEDDPDLASLLTEMLHRQGVRTQAVGSVAAAITAARALEPTLVLLDLLLPDGRGEELVEWLRTQDTLQTVPLLVYTALELSSSERERLRLGPTEVLTKARDPLDSVEARVTRLLRDAAREPWREEAVA